MVVTMVMFVFMAVAVRGMAVPVMAVVSCRLWSSRRTARGCPNTRPSQLRIYCNKAVKVAACPRRALAGSQKRQQRNIRIELTAEQVAAAVQSFALLADPTRVRMLWALRDGELDVPSLAAVAGCRPTVASQHLSKLRFAGLVEGNRRGQRVVVPTARRSRPSAADRIAVPRRPSGQRPPTTTSSPRPQPPTPWRSQLVHCSA